MGKRNGYGASLRASEWRDQYGGKKKTVSSSALSELPFDCCALTLEPFSTPVIGRQGNVYEVSALLPYIKEHGTDPVTGDALLKEDIVYLQFAKNDAGRYHCPVTFKVFNESSKICAIRTTGNVYAYDVVVDLNIKPSNWKDLLSQEPFENKDIILLQPKEVHADLSSKKQKTGPSIQLSGIAERILKKTSPPTKITQQANMVSNFTTTGASFVTPTAKNDENELRWKAAKKLKKKGYATIETSHGKLNVELHVNYTPRTCDNFLRLASKGSYDNVPFHRIIPGFMVQGGDPTGTGKGGESIWGRSFQDEFTNDGNPVLKHSKRGVLSMANSGPNTNGSQFFITLGPCSHLDGKHTVFGRLVGGFESLDEIEKVPVEDTMPLEPVTINRVLVFVNPFDELEKETPVEEAVQETLLSLPPKHDYSRYSETKKSNPPTKTQFKNFDNW